MDYSLLASAITMPELLEINLVQTMTTRRQTENEICHNVTAIFLSTK